MATPIIARFPHIQRAALELAYDNGMINARLTEADFLLNTDMVLGAEGVYENDLVALNDWLGTLSQDEIETVVAGEHEEMEALCANAPRGGPDNELLTKIFDDIFEGG